MSWAADKTWNRLVDYLKQEINSNREYAATVTLPDGDFAGTKYNPDIHPAQKIIFDMLDDGATWLTILKPVQDGGSLATFVPIMRRAHLLAQTVILGYPTKEKAKDAWTTKVLPMLEAQGGLIPKTGSGSRSGTASVLKLTTGGKFLLRSAGGRKEPGQAADTTDVLALDEVDDWPSMRVIMLIMRRLSKSRDPLFMAVSTLKRDDIEGEGESIILRLCEMGTESRVAFPCIHCGAVHVWEWENVDREHECLVCPNCNEQINDKQRIEMLSKPIRKDNNPRTHRKSLRWTALDSPFPLLVDGQKLPVIRGLIDEFEMAERSLAKGDHGLMRQFYRDRFCRPYRADLETDEDGQTLIPTRNRLAALSEASTLHYDVDYKEQDGHSWHLTNVPSWADHITVGVDVQAGGDRAPPRLYFVAYARGGARGALVGHGTIICCPAGRQATEAELHAALDRLRQLLDDWSPSVPIVRRGVDTGHNTDEIVRWLRVNPAFFALKGTGPIKADAGDRAGWVYIRKQERYMLYLIETKSATKTLQGEILARDGEGSCLIPHGLDSHSALVRHLCASVEYFPGKWSERPSDRKHHPEWQKRNDYADAAAYARALSYLFQTKPPQRQRKYGAVGSFL